MPDRGNLPAGNVGAAGQSAAVFGYGGSVTAYSTTYDYGWVAILLLAAGTWAILLDGDGLPVPSGLPWSALTSIETPRGA